MSNKTSPTTLDRKTPTVPSTTSPALNNRSPGRTYTFSSEDRNDLLSRLKEHASTSTKAAEERARAARSKIDLPPAAGGGDNDVTKRFPSRDTSRAKVTPYQSIFRSRVDNLADKKPHDGSHHDDGPGHGPGGPGGPAHTPKKDYARYGHGSHDRGPRLDSHGRGHGTPRHDYRMHGEFDRHALYPGRFYYGPYGYAYRSASLHIYLGSPLYSSYSRYSPLDPYYDSYYGLPYYMPYYVPYAVPAPYVAETQALEPDVIEPAAPAVQMPVVDSGAVIPAAEGAADFQLQAEQAFQQHRYEDAARLSNHAIVEDNQNGKLHLFASQTFFALEDYASAAAAIQQAATLLDRSDWGFVVENYQDFYRGDDYVTQMDKLNDYIDENPTAAYAYFLRGYHFLFLDHKEAARDDLAKAIELEPRDLLAAELLKMAGGEIPETQAVTPPEAEVLATPGNADE